MTLILNYIDSFALFTPRRKEKYQIFKLYKNLSKNDFPHNIKAILSKIPKKVKFVVRGSQFTKIKANNFTIEFELLLF